MLYNFFTLIGKLVNKIQYAHTEKNGDGISYLPGYKSEYHQHLTKY